MLAILDGIICVLGVVGLLYLLFSHYGEIWFDERWFHDPQILDEHVKKKVKKNDEESQKHRE